MSNAIVEILSGFPLKFSDLTYPTRISGRFIEGDKPDIPVMPISQERLRHWLPKGALSGYAAKIDGQWGFTSGIVERCCEIRQQQGARQPPQRPGITSGYQGVQVWAQASEITLGQAYRSLAITSGQSCQLERGIKKEKGRWLMPATLTSEEYWW